MESRGSIGQEGRRTWVRIQAGGARSVLIVRQVLASLNVLVIPQTVNVARADQAFDDAGRLKDARHQAAVEKACAELLRVAAALKA